VTSLADEFRGHAELLPDGLYRVLLRAMAADWEAGGVVREICGDQAEPGAVVQLRLLAGLQRLVLTRRAAQLAMYYPNLGGQAAPELAWLDVEPVLREHADELRRALELAPQTNEPGRSVALLVGLFDAVRRSGLCRVRLLELGASAGLNLLVDRYHVSGDGWTHGPHASPVRFTGAVDGAVTPAAFTVRSRRGCDLSPVDPATVEGRLRLTSFVWPHQLHRHERLRAAFQVAQQYPVPVDRAPAASWLAVQLAERPDPRVLTVVWHSITRQYWPQAEIDRVADHLDSARYRMPIAHIAMESPGPATDPVSPRRPAELTVQLTVPGAVADPAPELLATVDDHGVPVTMASR
jgi:hypothetical protein